MITLGINAAFHDSAAALVQDGRLVAAAEEERFTHVKHGKRPVPFSAWELPFHAIDYCLRESGIELKQVDHVAYSFDPELLLPWRNRKRFTLPVEPSAHAVKQPFANPWDPLFYSYILNAPRQLRDGAPHHLERRFAGIGRTPPFRWHYISHHTAHAASAFLPSPFDSAAILTLDGRGEQTTTSYAVGEGQAIRSLGEVRMPHSLGMLYEELTRRLGFLHSSDEYKVMALASFGEPRFADRFRDMIRIGERGDYAIDWAPFADICGPPRRTGDPIEQRHYDVAASLQQALEETVFAIARWLRSETGLPRLCMAGGVALNCVMNGRLLASGIFEDIWIQPAAGDAGTALGAALWVDARESPRTARSARTVMDHAFWGPEYSDAEIEEALRFAKLPIRRLDDPSRAAARLLEEEKILGWFQGRMEYGPRALGARSILASPRSMDMQQRLNQIKDREDFRPVAPVVLEEEAGKWFRDARPSPFMLFVFDTAAEARGKIPAVCHVDGTARIQTIRRDQNAPYYDTVRAFGERTGVPVLVNTSFNTRGKPIVCSPRDALECFWTSPLDALVIGPFLVEKEAPSRNA